MPEVGEKSRSCRGQILRLKPVFFRENGFLSNSPANPPFLGRGHGPPAETRFLGRKRVSRRGPTHSKTVLGNSDAIPYPFTFMA
jgi:hypothetical protein